MHEKQTSVSEKYPQAIQTALFNISDVLSQLDDPVTDGIPFVSKETRELIESNEDLPPELTLGYISTRVKTDKLQTKRTNREPYYNLVIDDTLKVSASNLQKAYATDSRDNVISELMIEAVDKDPRGLGLKSAISLLKKLYNVNSIEEILVNPPEDDAAVEQLIQSIRSGDVDPGNLFHYDKGGFATPPRQDRRKLMRAITQVATGVQDPVQADRYIYALSNSVMGEYSLTSTINDLRSYPPNILEKIDQFSHLTAIGLYDAGQIERMYKLASGDQEEIDRLKSHDVNILFINRQGDHNGISSEVAKNMDDEQGRTLFFEISNPHQIYKIFRQLDSLGINPSTAIFASHGSAGQFFISEAPDLDKEKGHAHVTLVVDQEVANAQLANMPEDERKRYSAYSLDNANGLIRSIQRYMQPSRGIDDPDTDFGRKKIISLSCNFDAPSKRASLGSDGSIIKGSETSLLKRFAEIIARKIPNEHVDIYGATIATNSHTPTAKGFYYNQLRNGLRAPYPASVSHVDDGTTSWHKQNEVKLRK